MPADLDIIDTQVLVFSANGTHQWAEDIYDQILAGNRIVYIPRYVLSEFYEVMGRNQGDPGKNLAWKHIRVLWNSPAAITAHPHQFRIDLDAVRHHAVTRTLATVCQMDVKDAPILATAYRLVEFIESYNQQHHSLRSLPRYAEEFRLGQLLSNAGYSSVSPTIVTNEQNFVGVNLNRFNLPNVSISQVP